MLIVRVELWSAITGQRTELARMEIVKTGGGTAELGSYHGETYVGRTSRALDRHQVNRTGQVVRYPRRRHVWNLVARMLDSMEYSA